jgi:hypothetical protein
VIPWSKYPSLACYGTVVHGRVHQCTSPSSLLSLDFANRENQYLCESNFTPKCYRAYAQPVFLSAYAVPVYARHFSLSIFAISQDVANRGNQYLCKSIPMQIKLLTSVLQNSRTTSIPFKLVHFPSMQHSSLLFFLIPHYLNPIVQPILTHQNPFKPR